jgi:hypothetical protein
MGIFWEVRVLGDGSGAMNEISHVKRCLCVQVDILDLLVVQKDMDYLEETDFRDRNLAELAKSFI